ncbi:MAG: cobalamin B12-binding domain-containing protein [Candidatus Baldrarchaeia archaeon]
MSDSELYKALVELDEEKVLSLVKRRLEKGEDPYQILEECRRAMTTVGEKFEKGEYFLNDLVIAGEIFKMVSELLKPKLEEGRGKREIGTMVIGTVQGDIHDLGKNIAKILLEAAGFRVYDLGVDVPPDAFVQAVKQYNPDIVGMSCLLTSAWKSIKKTVERLKEENLRDKVKIVLGGAMVNERVAEMVGADAWTNDAKKGVDICKKFVGAD